MLWCFMSLIVVARRGFAGVLALFVLAGGGLARCADDSVGQWIVVSPPDFRPALAPLIEHRQAEGFKVVVLETTDVLSREQLHQRDGTPLLARLNELVQHYNGRSCLLLAGICGTAGMTNAENAVTPSLRGATGRMKGEASDSGYGLPGQEGTPTVAVGRLPARTVGSSGPWSKRPWASRGSCSPLRGETACCCCSAIRAVVRWRRCSCSKASKLTLQPFIHPGK